MGNLQSTPSSSTTTTFQKKYDVFLNFRGEDTRNCFTCHLYKALHEKVETFIDDGLDKGDGIWLTLKGAIEQSKISVVIFSKDYASSKWCLRELVEIMERKNMHNQIVIPIFYRIDPSNVRHQTESFKKSFDNHGEESQEEVKKWREALTEASNLSGWDSSVTRPDTTLVDQIVKDILKKLMGECTSHDYGALIGHKQIEEVLSLLCLHVPNVQIIGIWGMGGIGKTTIADAIFNKKSNQFEGVCFIQNVRERLQNSGGLVSLRKEILSQVLKDEHLKVDSPTIPSIIKARLNRTMVLIVLDDVDDYLPLENLARGVDRFGLGSRIIITSRDKQVLQLCGVNDQNIYEVKGFNDHDALQLFCNYAFHENHPPEDRTVLSNELVNYSKGNPLALKVLGSSSFLTSKQEWDSVVNTLRTKNLNRRIFNVLKISYDGLEDSEKNTFLDIVCFFKWKTRGYVEKIIGDCCKELGALIKKSLITISNGYIEMHDLLEEMGREIVDNESPNKPGKRSRLWRQEEVQNILKYDEGTNAVQGIVLDLLNIKDMQLSPQAFKKMYNLRFLKFDYPEYCDGPCNSKEHFPNGLSDLSGKLRSLIWCGFPLTALPSNFNPKNLVELNLRDSSLERLWKGKMPTPNLRELILRRCKHLTNIPDLLDAPLLERIDLRHCRSLLDFPPVAPHLKYLHFLDLQGCKSLRSFQSEIHFESITSLVLCDRANLTKFPEMSGNLRSLDLSGTAIDEVPPSIGNLTKLSDLNLSKCMRLKHISTNICKLKSLQKLNLANCSALESFPEISGDLKSLDLCGSAIDEVPPSIGSLTKLFDLNLSQCMRLKHISTNICKLKSLHKLNLANCSALESFPEISGDLESLDLHGSAIDEVPPSIGSLTKLSDLNLSKCTRLKHISTNICKLKSLHKLNLANCSGLESFPEISGDLRWLDLSGTAIDEVPPSIGSLTKLSDLNLSKCTRLKHISTNIRKLKSLRKLNLEYCSALESLPEILPLNIELLSAIDCKQLRSIPDASELVKATFIFTNCPNVEETAVGNILATVEGYQGGFGLFSFCCPGSEIPEWFSYKSNESSIKFRMPWHDCFHGLLPEFIVCAVTEFEEYRFDANDKDGLRVFCSWTFSDGDEISYPFPVFRSFIMIAKSRIETLIDSDHVALGHCKPLCHTVVFQSEFINCSFEFRLSEDSPNCRVKSCGVWPRTKIDKVKYAEPIKISGVTIEDIEETIGKRICASNDHQEEEVEPHFKRLNLDLENWSELEIFPEIWETMEGLRILELSGTSIKELPGSICNLTSLECLHLSDCSKLEILVDNLGNLKSLIELSIDRTAISQLPSTMMHLNKLDSLSCHGCRGLRFTHSSYFPCSLRYLYLSDCNLKEIPEDICHLSSLVHLELSGNDFKSLPRSMKQLSRLRNLEVNNCNMLRSLTELPINLKVLSACDCKQLRSILLDASETNFFFTNCPNLEETAVGNILATVEGYEGELDPFSIFYPGSEVPGWFSYKSNESSIKFRMARHDCFNGLLLGFIVCAVIEFEEYRFDANDKDGLRVFCSWAFSDGYESDPFSYGSCTLIADSSFGTLIDSDHVALWYYEASDHQFTNCSFQFWLSEYSPNCRVKSCGVRPITVPNEASDEDDKVIYAEPIFGVTIEDIGETSGKRSRTSNDHPEEGVEPHSKRSNLDLSH